MTEQTQEQSAAASALANRLTQLVDRPGVIDIGSARAMVAGTQTMTSGLSLTEVLERHVGAVAEETRPVVPVVYPLPAQQHSGLQGSATGRTESLPPGSTGPTTVQRWLPDSGSGGQDLTRSKVDPRRPTALVHQSALSSGAGGVESKSSGAGGIESNLHEVPGSTPADDPSAPSIRTFDIVGSKVGADRIEAPELRDHPNTVISRAPEKNYHQTTSGSSLIADTRPNSGTIRPAHRIGPEGRTDTGVSFVSETDVGPQTPAATVVVTTFARPLPEKVASMKDMGLSPIASSGLGDPHGIQRITPHVDAQKDVRRVEPTPPARVDITQVTELVERQLTRKLSIDSERRGNW